MSAGSSIVQSFGQYHTGTLKAPASKPDDAAVAAGGAAAGDTAADDTNRSAGVTGAAVDDGIVGLPNTGIGSILRNPWAIAVIGLTTAGMMLFGRKKILLHQ
jgi:hypothetical protein